MMVLRTVSVVIWSVFIGLANNVDAGDQQLNSISDGEILLEYSSLGYHYDLIEEFVKNNVPFYLDNEGIVRVDDKYEKEAKRITERLETRPHTKFSDKKYASLLVLLLQKEGIEFVIRTNIANGEIHLIWNQPDDVEVRKIMNGPFLQALKNSSNKRELGRFEGRSD